MSPLGPTIVYFPPDLMVAKLIRQEGHLQGVNPPRDLVLAVKSSLKRKHQAFL